MTAKARVTDWFAWMEKNLVKLQPVIEMDKSLKWSAGYTTLGSLGQNIAATCAWGSTPVEALENLKAKKYWIKNNRLVKTGF
jgi:hypothetical protein